MMTEQAARAALTCTNICFAYLAWWVTMTTDRCPDGRLPPKLGMNRGYPRTQRGSDIDIDIDSDRQRQVRWTEDIRYGFNPSLPKVGR